MPLHLAAAAGQLEVVKFLISDHFSYDPKVKDGENNTAMHCATVKGHLHIVQYFIEVRKWSPTLPGHGDQSLLHIACYNGSPFPL